MNSSTRCAGCKYLRRRCPSDCILSPYFPPNNPQRFSYVHKIYGASNVGKMIQQVPVYQRVETANSLYYEAYCRIQDPVYGCVGIITVLYQQLYEVECELAKTRAEIDVHRSLHAEAAAQQTSFPDPHYSNNMVGFGNFSSTYNNDPSTSQFYY